MKIVMLMLIICPIWAKIPQVMQCLANEEYIIHKDASKQYLYRLNQMLVNEFASASSIDLRPEKLNQICQGAASENLLKALLLEGKNIFIIKTSLLENERYMIKTSIETLLDRTTKIFFQYLLVLENNVGVPNCLRNAIPEIGHFSSQFQDLQVQISRDRLLAEKEKIVRLFAGIKKIESIKKRCKSKSSPKS